jgi:hypothetical protein
VSARKIASELLEERDIGPLRAEALVLLAEFEGLDRAVALLEEALQEAESQPALQARSQCQLAGATRFKKCFAGALEHGQSALALADEVDDDTLRIDALAMLAFLGTALGDPETAAHAARAQELARAAGARV